MKNNYRFLTAVGGVSLVVGYLIWTGVTETMLEKGSWSRDSNELLHHFTVADLEDESIRFPVEYRDILPDTFNDQELQDVVLEGRFREDGVFAATVVLTKCGSRYEATPEELLEDFIE
jgi:cytochrome c-type biogenesis protein CcmE